MTPAERQQLKRDRAKASLVRLEFWVKQDKVDAITQASAWQLICAEWRGLHNPQTPIQCPQRPSQGLPLKTPGNRCAAHTARPANANQSPKNDR